MMAGISKTKADQAIDDERTEPGTEAGVLRAAGRTAARTPGRSDTAW